MSRARVCNVPGCPVLTAGGRCDQHGKPDLRPSPSRYGYDARWAKLSRRFRKLHPVCQWPGCVRPSEVTDHIDGQGPRGPRGFDEANLQALCWSHHSHKTATLDGGFGNRSKRGVGRDRSAGTPVSTLPGASEVGQVKNDRGGG